MEAYEILKEELDQLKEKAERDELLLKDEKMKVFQFSETQGLAEERMK